MAADVRFTASVSLGLADEKRPLATGCMCVHGEAGNESLGGWEYLGAILLYLF